MNEVNFRVVKFALFSRFHVILIQVLSNLFIPDHDAKVFVTPLSRNATILDHFASPFLDGFARWDAQYFLHIVHYGYTYENSLAFFPLFPVLVGAFKYFCFPYFEKHDYYCLLFTGTILNTLFFCIAALFVYKLSCLVLKSKELSLIASFLFCINPSSIFFSAFYSESLFCMLTFIGLYFLECGYLKPAVTFLGLSAVTRSNGIISFGFLLHFMVSLFFQKAFYLKKSIFRYFTILLSFIQMAILSFVIFILPFSAYQLFAFLLYCTSYFKTRHIPDLVKDYAVLKHFKLPSDSQSEWCSWSMPMSYSYVQKQYWNVGFLQYYELKQIPNFLLALPILLIILSASVKYFQHNKKLTLSLGLLPSKKSMSYLFNNEMCFIYFVHAFIFSVFCLLFIHIQVTTRLLSSSSPVLYWIVASLISSNKTALKTNFQAKNNVIQDFLSLQNIMASNTLGKLCYGYFVIYFVVGTIMHVNHLPWT